MWNLVGWIVLLGGSPDGLEVTDRLVPPGWVGNPWGPEATRLREAGEFPSLPSTPEMDRWEAWGRKHLKDGDILFRRGDARLMRGYFPASRFIANVSNSQFSHTGTAAIEGGRPFVYDTTSAGPRRQPFAIWVLDNAGPFGAKRLKPEYQDRVPKVLEYCRRVYNTQVPFDYDLGIDDSALYCLEMSEKAFRSAGIKLSDPVRLGEIENAAQFPICMFVFSTFTNLRLDQEVYFPGNARHGIWSSPLLDAVYVPPAYAGDSPPQVPGD